MNKLRIHYFQHVEHEGLGSIEEWIRSSGHSSRATKFFEKTDLPELTDFDWLIVMGGSMSVNDEGEYPWLSDEKKFIKKAIDAGKTVLGICLGSQLVSSALGAQVYKNQEKEIGWYDIETSCFARSSKLFFDRRFRLRLVKTPMHLWLGSLRVLEVTDIPDFFLDSPRHGDDLISRLAAFGHLPYEPPNVSGWHRDLDWLTPSDVSRRIAQCTKLAEGKLTFKNEATNWRVNLYNPVHVIDSVGGMNNIEAVSQTLCNDVLGVDDADLIQRLHSQLRSRPMSLETRQQQGLSAVMSSPFYQLF